MKIFRLKADFEFEADDLIDAFNRLSLHFRAFPGEGDEGDGTILDGSIVVSLVDGIIKLEA